LLAQGQADLSAAHYEQAAARFRSVLARRPEAPEALFGLGIAASQLGHFTEARQALERYIKMQPSDADGHCALGVVLLAEGQRAGAKTELQRALRLEPHNLEAAKALAHIATSENDGARAVALLKPLVASSDFDDEARRLLAAGYAQSKDDRSALATLGPVLDRRPPPPPDVFVLVAGSARRAGDAEVAAHTCELGLRLYLNSDEIEQRCLGIVSMSFVDRLQATLNGTADDVPTLIVMGRLLAELGEVADESTRDRCIGLLRKAVALSSSGSDALYNLGTALRKLGHLQEASTPLNEALTAQPSDELKTLIWTQIGLTKQQLQELGEARDAFGRAFELNRKLLHHSPASAFEFYSFLSAANERQHAEAVLSEILKWDPSFVPARMEHARILASRDRVAEAVQEAEFVAQNTDPGNRALLRSAHLFLLHNYAKLGRTEDEHRERAWLKDSPAAELP
jgi:tetratricopeptide (TPR) repeat protein